MKDVLKSIVVIGLCEAGGIMLQADRLVLGFLLMIAGGFALGYFFEVRD